MARKPTEVDNSFLVELLNSYDGVNDISGWIQDIIVGAARLGHSNDASPDAILKALSSIPVITFDSVGRFVNIKHVLFGDKKYSDRHVYAFMNRVISARKGIEYHWKRYTKVDFPVIKDTL